MTAVHADSPTDHTHAHTLKSGLGTPDFFYFAGAADTPSWLKTRPQSANKPKPIRLEQNNNNNNEEESKSTLHLKTAAKSPDIQPVDENIRSRALSDPPIRPTPSWLVNNPAAKHLDSEPNPFERSFSGKTPYEMVQMNRRARSISPKSSHGAAMPLPGHQSKLPPFGTMSTPSNDFFDWGLGGTDSLRSGPLSPSMLNGPAYGNSNISAFDPSTIRTGLTPGNGISNYAPHSPATQALFAMMTNSTPGLPGVPKMDERIADNIENVSQSYDGRRHQAPHPGAIHYTSDGSRGSSSSSNANNNGNNNNNPSYSPSRSQHLPHLQPSFSHAQAVPKPLPPHQMYRGTAQTQPASFMGNTSGGFVDLGSQLLQQNAPRPLPSQTGPAGGSNNPNPLYLLSHAQGHANSDAGMTHKPASNPFNNLQNQVPPADIGMEVSADDAILAAAAGLSGLATPRPNNVAGPVPAGHHAIAPTNLNVATSANLALPGHVGADQDVTALTVGGKRTRTRSQQNIAQVTTTASAASTSGQKRKAPATKRNQSEAKKPKRTTRRAAAANQPIVDEDTPPEDTFDDSQMTGSAGDDIRQESALLLEEDTYSNAGSSQRRSESAKVKLEYDEDDGEDGDDGDGSQKLSTSKQIKPGRGPKQQFETEEEKRKNFLERNRQAALKCRQRKKQWLNELQHKVEILTQENETLQQTAAQIREEATQLRAILLGHKDCQMSMGVPGMPPGQSVTIGQMLGGPVNMYPSHQQTHARRI